MVDVHARRESMPCLIEEEPPVSEDTRNACHRPTVANGKAVVSSNGRPSVK